jgi:pimeloyl-ACP methyl ester carboxylesterase
MRTRIRPTSYDEPVRRLALVLVSCSALVVACGDGIDEGANEGRGTRGTIDGVALGPPDSVDITDPPATTDPAFPDFPDFPDDTTPDLPTLPGDELFGWESFGDGLEDGYLEVPLDWDDPDGDTILLYLVRHRAVDPDRRIGTLLVNPGGPGFGGSGLAYDADSIYGQDLLDRFDIIGWDPRGTGFSEPYVDCVDDYDAYFALDSSPDTEEERSALVAGAGAFVEQCRRKNLLLLPHLSTADTARDMDAIRTALQEDRISYFGFSYGSELGATWATMFPDTVRAAVLDGAVDPTVGYFEQNVQQAAGFEAAFTTFLAQCSADPACAFHNGGDAEGAFDELHTTIEATPIAGDDPDRPKVTDGVLVTAIAQSMYDRAAWPELEQALADLQDGDGSAIVALYDLYYGYFEGEWDDGLEAYFAISCLDDPGSTGPDDLFAREAELAAAAPRLGRSWLGELVICSKWLDGPAPAITITGAGAGPILVMGTTGDPATPLDSTRRMAQTLEDGHLVVVAADQHTGYGVNRCGNDVVDAYLLDPTAPLDDEIDCT